MTVTSGHCSQWSDTCVSIAPQLHNFRLERTERASEWLCINCGPSVSPNELCSHDMTIESTRFINRWYYFVVVVHIILSSLQDMFGCEDIVLGMFCCMKWNEKKCGWTAWWCASNGRHGLWIMNITTGHISQDHIVISGTYGGWLLEQNAQMCSTSASYRIVVDQTSSRLHANYLPAQACAAACRALDTLNYWNSSMQPTLTEQADAISWLGASPAFLAHVASREIVSMKVSVTIQVCLSIYWQDTHTFFLARYPKWPLLLNNCLRANPDGTLSVST